MCVCVKLCSKEPSRGVSIAGCPTKRAMPRLIWRLIISTYLLLRPRKPYKCVPPEEWGCCRYFYRLVMACSKNYLLPTHRFSVFIHGWTRTVVHHIDACIYQTSVFVWEIFWSQSSLSQFVIVILSRPCRPFPIDSASCDLCSVCYQAWQQANASFGWAASRPKKSFDQTTYMSLTCLSSLAW